MPPLLNFSRILQKAVEKVLTINPALRGQIAPSDISGSVTNPHLPLHLVLAQAVVIADKEARGVGSRPNRDGISFVMATRSASELAFTEKSSVMWSLDCNTIRGCMISANIAIELIHDLSLMYDVELFQLLGMRNLSSFVGEVFAKEIREAYAGRFMGNPNQDGYPDLCALTAESKEYMSKLTNADGSLKPDKHLWSPYPFGGVEVKATCGNTPSASRMPKPKIGEPRLQIMVSAEWKAHHQLTKQLLGILWDFVDGLPTILATFYRNDLDTRTGTANRDWGAIIHPREEGGRTTSVSIMKRGRTSREGVKKMGAGWAVLPKTERFLEPICRIFAIDSPI